jgi:hypothetical protein
MIIVLILMMITSVKQQQHSSLYIIFYYFRKLEFTFACHCSPNKIARMLIFISITKHFCKRRSLSKIFGILILSKGQVFMILMNNFIIIHGKMIDDNLLMFFLYWWTCWFSILSLTLLIFCPSIWALIRYNFARLASKSNTSISLLFS